MDLPARAFTPPPKVNSAVVHLKPRDDRPDDETLHALELITAAAFGQRRKMLRQSLKGLGVDAAELLALAGVTPTSRAEELPVEAFVALANAWKPPA